MFIFICGESGSGKTRVADAIGKTLGNIVIHLDAFYKSDAKNFEDPTSLDWERVEKAVKWAGATHMRDDMSLDLSTKRNVFENFVYEMRGARAPEKVQAITGCFVGRITNVIIEGIFAHKAIELFSQMIKPAHYVIWLCLNHIEKCELCGKSYESHAAPNAFKNVDIYRELQLQCAQITLIKSCHF